MSLQKLLVLNAGSSSLKFKLFELLKGADNPLRAVASGLCERIGDHNSQMKANVKNNNNNTVTASMPDHEAALTLVQQYLQDVFSDSIYQDIKVVGHRVVHGLDISQPVLITDAIKQRIREASELAPLHNTPNLQGIEAAQNILPKGIPQVAVFDTAFHQGMDPEAYVYSIPYELYEKKAYRRYGFHGQSYTYLTEKASEILQKPQNQLNAILCHLGAGSSMCAVQNGRSIDTTMGMTPLEGLMMGTRCGDLDPGIVLQLAHTMPLKEVETMLNKKSGWLGLAGSVDVRTVSEGAANGDYHCQLALKVYTRRVKKYIGAYTVYLKGNVDALVFSAGVGENSAALRSDICAGLEFMGVETDKQRNEKGFGDSPDKQPFDIATKNSKVRVLVIPTDEEYSIAKQALEVVNTAGLMSG